MTAPLTSKPTQKAETLAKASPTITSSREEDVALNEVTLPRYLYVNDIVKTNDHWTNRQRRKKKSTNQSSIALDVFLDVAYSCDREYRCDHVPRHVTTSIHGKIATTFENLRKRSPRRVLKQQGCPLRCFEGSPKKKFRAGLKLLPTKRRPRSRNLSNKNQVKSLSVTAHLVISMSLSYQTMRL